MKRTNTISMLSLALMVLMFPFSPAIAAPGVTASEIRFGQSAMFTGPSENIGQRYRTGILAAFSEINSRGGVQNGRKLVLESQDDGYEPKQAIQNTHEFINSGNIFALIGETGSPTSKFAAPIARKAKVPFIGPLTGSSFLRDSQRFPNVVNLRASYDQEVEKIVEYLIHTKGKERIAIFYEDDSFGRDGLRSINKALHHDNRHLVARGAHARNLSAVHSALFTISKGEPDAVVLVGTYRANGAFIELARSLDLDALFVNLSFVSAESLAQILGEKGEGVLVSQVVPFPWSDTLPLLDQYRHAIERYSNNRDFDFVSLEGYILGRYTIEVLQRMGETLSREHFMETALSSEPYDIGGWEIHFSNDSNQGTQSVELSEIQKDGTLRIIEYAIEHHDSKNLEKEEH